MVLVSFFMVIFMRVIGLYIIFLLLATGAQAGMPIPAAGQTFSDYQQQVKGYLQSNKQWLDIANKQREIEAVLPFEIASRCDAQESTGVLLFHGLSDSPYTLRDVATNLANACLHVRVMLLPGHGTAATDLLTVTRDDWRQLAQAAARQFAMEVDSFFVGGFSTGGALATELALAMKANQGQQLRGVILFSPLFKINSSIDWISPYLAPFIDWLDHYPDDDFAKYASIPVPAIAQAYRLAKEVSAQVSTESMVLPVWVAASQEDATVDTKATLSLFKEYMAAQKQSRMVLYRYQQDLPPEPDVTERTASWPQDRVLGMSHIGLHIAPVNPYYGQQGDYRACGWYFSEPEKYAECRSDPQNWFGEKGDWLQQAAPAPGRVSWNPDYAWLMGDLTAWIQQVMVTK
ncbi:alpha/beta fold hydrolase [Maribrevibacterium harenarium]|uniref:Alpha/beta fold hydrolase n=1 Tax=Maribrevibacterium harenarium TaxID=2589817 RepID=A0A501WSP6_9GAMM|nr:alpha/beta fold hydrolase [Maribrevibacterium harenarium]TPE50031.1 alpha/beta fold hydrolase [Maribrevibacterium harenarium]